MSKDLKKTDKGNLHKGHRERMREKILKSGFEALPDHEKLEVLLFGSIPRANTNETAHRLLNRFGSFSAVLDATPAELEKIEGMGATSAFQLSIFPRVAEYYFKDKRVIKKRFETIDEIGKYVTTKFINNDIEKFYVFCLDAKGSLISETLLQTGSVNCASVDTTRIAQIVFRDNTSKFVVAHNHPHGICIPSADDLDVTARIIKHFKNFKVEFLEHFIVVDDKYCGIKPR